MQTNLNEAQKLISLGNNTKITFVKDRPDMTPGMR